MGANVPCLTMFVEWMITILHKTPSSATVAVRVVMQVDLEVLVESKECIIRDTACLHRLRTTIIPLHPPMQELSVKIRTLVETTVRLDLEIMADLDLLSLRIVNSFLPPATTEMCQTCLPVHSPDILDKIQDSRTWDKRTHCVGMVIPKYPEVPVLP